MIVKVEVSCRFCRAKTTHEIKTPDGWDARYYETVFEALCPEHAGAAAFADSQCPGCVGGWGECDLFRGLEELCQHHGYPYRPYRTGNSRALEAADLTTMKQGICPRRTNGTMIFDSNKRTMESVDLRDPAGAKGGQAAVRAFGDYLDRYKHPDAPNPR